MTLGRPEPRAAVAPLLLGTGWHSAGTAGGLSRYLGELLGSLQRAGSAATAVVLGPAPGAPANVVVAGHDTAPLLLRLRRFQRAAEQAGADADVVDAHFALYALWPVVLGRLRSVPLVVHFQGPWSEESVAAGERPGARTALKRVVELAVYRRARRVVVLSSAFKRLLVEDYGLSPWGIQVIAPGVDLERFRPGDPLAARARLGVAPDRPLVFAARRMVPRMGLDVLLEAWPMVQAACPAALLVLAGDGPERASLEARARGLGVSGLVRFLGRVDDDTLVACYQAADVSVVPTLALEGFGLVVVESLACGTPVVVTDVGGLPESVARLDPSLVVPPNDPDAVGSRLAEVLSGTRPAPTPQRCRRHAQAFSWEEVAARHQSVYRRAVDAGGDGRLRVVYLDHCAQLSGGELALLTLLPALPGVDAHVILAEEGPLVGRLLQAGISTEVLPMAENARGLPRGHVRPGRRLVASSSATVTYVARLARRLRRLRPDAVHTNSLKAAVYGGLAARMAGVACIWHLHDRIARDYLPPAAVRLVRALGRRLPVAVLVNSESTRETLGDLAKPIAVVASPVSFDRARFEELRGSCARSRLCVGMVGRLAPWKGQHVFLDAFARAFSDDSAEGVVVGAALFGEERYETELRDQCARLGLDDRVTFAGFQEDIEAELAGMDVLVHASVLPEPFGRVVVEGMAAGLAVVAADAGGPAAMITDGVDGLLFPSGSSEALAAVLRRLADDPALRTELGAAARQVPPRYAPDVVGGEVEAFYRSVLDG